MPLASALVSRKTLSGQVGLGGRMMGLAWVLDQTDSRTGGTWGVLISAPGDSGSLLASSIDFAGLSLVWQQRGFPLGKKVPLKI